MKSREDLIYSLLFEQDKIEYIIHMADYIKKVYKYEKFISEIKDILVKSDIDIISEEIDVHNKNAVDIVWIVRVKR